MGGLDPTTESAQVEAARMVREKLAEAERRLCEAEAEVKKNAQAGVA